MILPADNIKDTADIPRFVREALVLYPVTSSEQVIVRTLMPVPAKGAGNG